MGVNDKELRSGGSQPPAGEPPATSMLAPGKRTLTDGLARATHEPAQAAAPMASATQALSTPTAPPLPVVADVLAQVQAVTGQLLPGYRLAVEMIHVESAAELGLTAVEAYRHVVEIRSQLAEGDSAGDATAYASELAQVDAVLIPTEQALAWQLGPQTFHGQPVISGAYATPLGPRAERADRLAREVFQVVALLDVARRVAALLPNPSERYSVPIPTDVADQVVALVEPWRSRPVNFAFLRAALSATGSWRQIESLQGSRVRTLGQLDQDVRIQAQETGALGNVGDFDADQVAGVVVPQGFDRAGADEVYLMLTSAATDALGGLVIQLAKMGRLDAVLGANVRPRAQVQALHDALPFDGAPSNKAARRLLRPILEAPITHRVLVPGLEFEREPGGKSNTRVLDEAIEDSDSKLVRGHLRALRFLYHGASLGFAAEHDAAYDDLQAGTITAEDLDGAKRSAVAKAWIVGGVSALSGGMLGAYGAGLVKTMGPRTAALVEGAVGGMVGGFTGAATADGYDVATGAKDAGDVSGWDWGKAGAYGLAIGAGLSASAVLSAEAARHIPGGKTRAQGLAERHPRYEPLFNQMRLLGERDAITIRATARQIREWLDAGILPPGGGGPALALAGSFGDEAALLVRIEATKPLNAPGELDGAAITVIDAELEARPMLSSGDETVPGAGGSDVSPSQPEAARTSDGAGLDPVAWVDDLKSRLSSEELARFEKMTRKMSPAKIRDLYGGDFDAALDVVKGATTKGQASADHGHASQVRAAELRAAIERRGLMSHPEVVAAIDRLGPSPSPRALEGAAYQIRSRLMSEVLEAETAAAYPGAEVLRDVDVWVEQEAAVRGATLLDTPNGKRWHLKRTDIDVLVLERPVDGGKARIVHREEIKTGNDQPSKARRQLENGANAISTAAQGGRPVRLIAQGRDITEGIDLSTVDRSTGVTRGAAGKEFDRSLGITADDLLGLVEDLIDLERKSRTGGGQ